jgi:putative endonuclease
MRSKQFYSETLAVVFLMLKGWKIIGRNLNIPTGEIYILARRGKRVAIVEVKYRTKEPLSWISSTQKRRLLNSRKWIHPWFEQDCSIEIHMILLRPWKFPNHIECNPLTF